MRLHRRTSILVVLLISFSAPTYSFATKCRNLLHTNLTAIKIGFPKFKAKPANEVSMYEQPVEYFATAEGPGFFATNYRSIGYVNATTGNFETLVDPKGDVPFSNVNSSSETISFSTSHPPK